MDSENILKTSRQFYPGNTEQIYFCLNEAQCELMSDQVNFTKLTSLDNLLALLHRNRLLGNRLFESFKLVVEKNINKSLCDTLERRLPVASPDGSFDRIMRSARNAQFRETGFKAKVFANFKVVASDDYFIQILGSHVDRLIRKMRYLVNISETTKEYHLWNVLAIECPSMTKQKFYETIERCLSLDPSINSNVRNDEAVTKLKDSFLDTIARDKSNERDLLLRLSGTFRGRIRWSILFVEYFFMAYLESIDIPEADRRSRA